MMVVTTAIITMAEKYFQRLPESASNRKKVGTQGPRKNNQLDHTTPVHGGSNDHSLSYFAVLYQGW